LALTIGPATASGVTCRAHDGLPDTHCTPGRRNPAVTPSNSSHTICVSGWTRKIRPHSRETNPIKEEREIAYGIPAPHPKRFRVEELDHLIPLALGGAPRAVSNLWPEPADHELGYHRKDRLEVALQKKVCAHKLGLRRAQQAIASNWVTAYNRYIGPLKASSPTTSVKSASSAVTVGATREGGPFFNDITPTNGGKLALKAPVPDNQLKTRGSFVGDIIDGSHIGRVYIAGAADRSIQGVVQIPLEIRGLESVGTYEGALSVARHAKPADAIKVKLKVADAWWWAVGALLLGTALVLLPQIWLRRKRPEKALHDRHRELLGKYNAAQGSFTAYFANYPNKNSGASAFKEPSDADINSYAKSVDTAIRTYAKSTWYFDTTSDAYKKIDQSLKLAETDAAFYGDAGGFGKSLVELDTALSKLARVVRISPEDDQVMALVDGRLSVDRRPALALAAASVLKGAVLKIGGAEARARQANDYTTLIGTWCAMAEQTKRYELWALAVAEFAESNPAGSSEENMSFDDLAQLRVATGKIYEGKNELLDATDASTLTGLGAAKALDAAYGTLASLGGLYSIWVPPLPISATGTAPSPPVIRALTLLENGPIKRAALGSQVPEETDAVEKWVESVKSVAVTPAQAVVLRKTLRWIADAGVVALALVVGIIAALDTLWFGKTWGTLQDYLSFIFVGVAAQGVAKGLTGTLTQLRGGAVAPPVESAPKAAEPVASTTT
jgi:hypothetical protein